MKRSQEASGDEQAAVAGGTLRKRRSAGVVAPERVTAADRVS